MFKEAFCVLRMGNEVLFYFYRLYLMTHMSSGDGKDVIFLSFDSSFMWCEHFFHDELFRDGPLFFIRGRGGGGGRLGVVLFLGFADDVFF